MRKWLLIAFIPISIFAVIVWRKGEACQAATDQCAAANSVKPQSNNAPLSHPPSREDSVTQQPNTHIEKDDSCYRSRIYLCQILSPANLPNIFLVLIGVGGIIVAIGTLDILNRQTEAAEKSAEATRASVKATIATQRAFLTADLMRQATKIDDHWYKTDPYTVMLSDSELSEGFYYGYKLHVTNIGKTPALITGFEIRASLLKNGENELPPNSGDVIAARSEMRTLPEEDTVILFYIKIDGYIVPYRRKIENLESTVVFHGWVRYRPIIDPSDECFADYCYIYNPKQQVLIRRDECNANAHKSAQKVN